MDIHSIRFPLSAVEEILWNQDWCSNAYLSCDSRPHFERVVVGAADDAVAAELEAGDHVVIVTFQHLESEQDNDTVSSASNITAADEKLVWRGGCVWRSQCWVTADCRYSHNRKCKWAGLLWPSVRNYRLHSVYGYDSCRFRTDSPNCLSEWPQDALTKLPKNGCNPFCKNRI